MMTNRYQHKVQNFVSAAIEMVQHDTGGAARLRRADNPATEYQSWEFLATHGVQLEYDNERIVFATVGAAIAKTKPEANGECDIGSALANTDDDRSQSNQARSRLQRLLASDDVLEVCRVLRPLLSLVQERCPYRLNFVGLLNDLSRFHWEDARRQIKARWADNFYHYTNKPSETGG